MLNQIGMLAQYAPVGIGEFVVAVIVLTLTILPFVIGIFSALVAVAVQSRTEKPVTRRAFWAGFSGGILAALIYPATFVLVIPVWNSLLLPAGGWLLAGGIGAGLWAWVGSKLPTAAFLAATALASVMTVGLWMKVFN